MKFLTFYGSSNPHDAWQKNKWSSNSRFLLQIGSLCFNWTTPFCTWLSIANFLISLCELCSWNSLHAIKQDLWGYEKNWGSKSSILAKAQFSTDNVVEPSNDPWGLKSLQSKTLDGTETSFWVVLLRSFCLIS